MEYFKNLGKDYQPWTFAVIPLLLTMILAYIYPRFYKCGITSELTKINLDVTYGCDNFARESLPFNIMFLVIYYACTVGILSYYYKNEKAVYIALPSTITLGILYGLFKYNNMEWGMASHVPIYIVAYLLLVLTINYAIVYG